MPFRLHVPPQEAYRALDALVAGNLVQIREAGAAGTFPVLQGLSDGLILYAPEEDLRATEDWWSWEDIQRRGVADCEDIAAAVAAELLASGTPARPLILPLASGDYHVVVEYRTAMGRVLRGDPTKLGPSGMVG